MIDQETEKIVQENFCVFNIQFSGGETRWVCDAMTYDGREMQFKGNSIADLFVAARNAIKPG